MKNKRFSKLILLALLLLVLLSACGKKNAEVEVGAPPITAFGQEIDIRAMADKLNNFRQVGIRDYENPMMKANAAYEAAIDEFVVGASEIMAVGQTCIVDQAKAQAFVVDAAIGDVSQEGMINALVSDNLTGAEPTAECVVIYQDLADYVMAHRANIKNLKLALYGFTIDYETYFTEWVGVDIFNDLLQVYGDSAVVYQQLEDNGVELPGTTDISWLPTDLLRATHSNYEICNYYMSGDFMQSLDSSTRTKFRGHEEALYSMFEATWIPAEVNGGVGQCTMYRWAAIRWFQRTNYSDTTRSIIEEGNQAIIPTPAPLDLNK